MDKPSEILSSLRLEYGEPSPILILAPTTRCGSTLLQRAINQAGQAIIYGENFIFMESAPLLLGGQLSDVEPKARAAKASMDAFVRGDTGLDGSNLFPDYRAYRKLLASVVFQIADFYRRESSQHGYARWGLKHQITRLPGFRNFIHLIPGFRSVTVFRDLVDVGKSMQTRWPENLASEAQCAEIGRRWRENLEYLLRLDRSRNLVIRYEDLVARPDERIPAIEAHLGLALSRDAFRKRVNAHTFDPATGRAGEMYRPPSALAPAKLHALLEGAQPLYGKIGYSAHA